MQKIYIFIFSNIVFCLVRAKTGILKTSFRFFIPKKLIRNIYFFENENRILGLKKKRKPNRLPNFGYKIPVTNINTKFMNN